VCVSQQLGSSGFLGPSHEGGPRHSCEERSPTYHVFTVCKAQKPTSELANDRHSAAIVPFRLGSFCKTEKSIVTTYLNIF